MLACLSLPVSALAELPVEKVRAESLNNFIVESDNQVSDTLTEVFTASGNVRLSYPNKSVTAKADKVQFFKKEGKIVMSGNVDVIRGDGKGTDTLKADRVVYFIKDDRLEAEAISDKQVYTKVLLKPSGSSTKTFSR